MTGISFKQIGEALNTVIDPEIHMSVAELGLIYGAALDHSEADGTTVKVSMSLTSPACPYGPMLMSQVHEAVAKLPGVKNVDVDLTFVPSWDPRQMASEEAKEQLGIY